MRLDLLDKSYGKYSQSLLKKIIQSNDKRILSLGCRTGNIEILMAKHFIPKGEIIAITANEEQLELAKRNAKNSSVKNIKFIVLNLDNLNYQAEFDFVYSRLLLGYLPNPKEILNRILKFLKREGTILLEELFTKTAFCYPENAAFTKAIDLLVSLGKIMQADYNIGQRLYKLMLDVGIEQFKMHISQPVFRKGAEKRGVELKIAELAPQFIKSELIKKEELDALINTIKDITGDENTIIAMPCLFQILAINN